MRRARRPTLSLCPFVPLSLPVPLPSSVLSVSSMKPGLSRAGDVGWSTRRQSRGARAHSTVRRGPFSVASLDSPGHRTSLRRFNRARPTLVSHLTGPIRDPSSPYVKSLVSERRLRAPRRQSCCALQAPIRGRESTRGRGNLPSRLVIKGGSGPRELRGECKLLRAFRMRPRP
jgi:hypothetical protein